MSLLEASNPVHTWDTVLEHRLPAQVLQEALHNGDHDTAPNRLASLSQIAQGMGYALLLLNTRYIIFIFIFRNDFVKINY